MSRESGLVGAKPRREPVTIRRLTQGDLEPWYALQLAAMADPYTRQGLEEEVDRRIGRSTGRFVQGELVAAFLGWLVVDELQIFQLATHPRWLRQGHGRALLSHVLRRARASGATMATLEVRVSNAAAIALYSGLGFVVNGHRRGFYPDGEDAALMCLDTMT